MHVTERNGKAAEVLRRCDDLRLAPSQLRLRLFEAAHLFRRYRAERWLGRASVRDYAADRLGTSGTTFRRWATAGRVLEEFPQLKGLFASGAIGDSQLVELASAAKPEKIESLLPHLPGITVRDLRELLREPTDDEGTGGESGPAPAPLQIVNFHVPRAFAKYVRESHRLATAQIGADCDDDARVQAILGEAVSDLELVVSAEDADRRFADYRRSARIGTSSAGQRLDRRGSAPAQAGPRPSERQPVGAEAILRQLRPLSRKLPAALRVSCSPDCSDQSEGVHDTNPSTFHENQASPPFDHQVTDPRQRARLLDAEMRRSLRKLQQLAIRLEDELLQFRNSNIPEFMGFSRIDDFADALLGIPASTVFELLEHARRRRRENPIAVAHANGEITSLQATLLYQLRRLHVPRSCLPRWIEATRHLTIRALRDRIAWVRQRIEIDYRGWLLGDCLPPTDDELRMSARPLGKIALDPETDELQTLLWAKDLPMTSISFLLEAETASFLFQLVASIEASFARDHQMRISPWQALVFIYNRARVAWKQLTPTNRHPFLHVLERDDWRCVAPGCTQRRGLEVHHIVFASQGGSDRPENLACLCAYHHRIAVHQRLARIKGDAREGASSLIWELGLDSEGKPAQVYHGDREVVGS